MACPLKRHNNGDKRTLSDLKTLGHQLLSSRAHINNLPLLLSYISPSSKPQYALESLLSLQSFFTAVLPELPRSKECASSDGDPEVIYGVWVRSKFDEFVNSLVEIAVCGQCDETLREVVLDTIMEFVKMGNRGRFYSALYHKLIQRIVFSSLAIEFLLESLSSVYFKYIDVRFFTYISIEKLCKILEASNSSGDKSVVGDGDDSKASLDLSIEKMYFILSHIPSMGALNESAETEMWTGSDFLREAGEDKQKNGKKSDKNGLSSGKISKKMRLKFTKAWLSFLRLRLPLNLYKEVLVNLPQKVIPYLSNPLMLCDFLTRSYDIGGVISVMALSGLFILMTQHELEYPNFYEKLYALLVPSIFMVKHRAKFFELLDSCLKSTHLPAYLVAAFAKKLSRLALVVPPSGALVIIALVHNLLRRHPSLNFLVNQENFNKNTTDGKVKQEDGVIDDSSNAAAGVSKEKQGIDRFKDEETDLQKSNALGSSLWEIEALEHHYCPPVSRFVLSLKNDLTVRAKTTELQIKDFSSASYSTIFGDEMRRRVKQVPLAFYKTTPTSLFGESDFPGWSFKYNPSSVANGHASEGHQ